MGLVFFLRSKLLYRKFSQRNHAGLLFPYDYLGQADPVAGLRSVVVYSNSHLVQGECRVTELDVFFRLLQKLVDMSK